MERPKRHRDGYEYSESSSESESSLESSSESILSSNEESNSDEIEANLSEVQEIVPSRELEAPRRSLRQRRETLKEAFTYLANGDVDSFLDTSIIREKLSAAFNLLKYDFNSGHNQAKMTTLWLHAWKNTLVIRSLGGFRVRGQCHACNRRRQLKHCLYLKPNNFDQHAFDGVDDNEDAGFELLGVMGDDCYTIKFSRLTRLISVCKHLIRDLPRTDFEEYALATLAPYLRTIQDAPADMRYRYQYAHFNRNDDEDDGDVI